MKEYFKPINFFYGAMLGLFTVILYITVSKITPELEHKRQSEKCASYKELSYDECFYLADKELDKYLKLKSSRASVDGAKKLELILKSYNVENN